MSFFSVPALRRGSVLPILQAYNENANNGTTFIDQMGNFNNNAPGSNFPVWGNNGYQGMSWAGYLSGSSSYHGWPSKGAVNFDFQKDWSMETWFAVNPPTGLHPLFAKNSAGNPFSPALVALNTDNTFRLYSSSNGAAWDNLNGQNLGTCPISQWAVFALTYIAATKQWQAYINGTRTANFNGTLVPWGGTTGNLLTGFSVGQGSFWNGYLAGMRWWNIPKRTGPSYTLDTLPVTNIAARSFSWVTPGTYSWISTRTGTATLNTCGGGGSGGSGNPSAAGNGGGGGGAGQFRTATVNLVAGTSYTIVVGSGGPYPGDYPANGFDGTASSFIGGSVSQTSDFGRCGARGDGPLNSPPVSGGAGYPAGGQSSGYYSGSGGAGGDNASGYGKGGRGGDQTGSNKLEGGQNGVVAVFW